MLPDTLARLDGKTVSVTQDGLSRPAHGELKANTEHRRLDLVVVSRRQARYVFPIENARDLEQILATEKERQIRFHAPRGFLPAAEFE